MCGESGKAVLRALTGALLCGLVSDAAYLQRYRDPYYADYFDQEAVRAKPLREHEKPQDLRNVPGVAGVDFPVYHSVPETHFSCSQVPTHPGMYANVETGCQAYHVCHDGREGDQGASFLCTNGTLFNQEKFACDWWYNVDCSQAIAHYKLNSDPLKNPYVPKPKIEEAEPQHHFTQRPSNIFHENHAHNYYPRPNIAKYHQQTPYQQRPISNFYLDHFRPTPSYQQFPPLHAPPSFSSFTNYNRFK